MLLHTIICEIKLNTMLPLPQVQFLQRRQDWPHYVSYQVAQAEKSGMTTGFEHKTPPLFDFLLHLHTLLFNASGYFKQYKYLCSTYANGNVFTNCWH